MVFGSNQPPNVFYYHEIIFWLNEQKYFDKVYFFRFGICQKYDSRLMQEHAKLHNLYGYLQF